MAKTLFLIFEAGILRAAPGLVNLATQLLIGSWFSPAYYGQYSTIIVSTGFVASMAFGPLKFAVVSQYAKLDAKGLADDYESSLVSAVLFISLFIGVLGSLVAVTGLISWAWIAPTITFGVYTAVQEILHARLRLLAYGGAAIIQAVVFFILAWFFVRHEPRPELALNFFAISYAVAAIISLAFSGIPCIKKPNLELLSSTLQVGGPYTLGTLAESGIYVGMRLLILLLGTPVQLGVFSFCVDIAQRLIGFLINVASFVIIPTAFRNDTKEDGSEFKKTLFKGAAFAIMLALASFGILLILRQTGWIAALNKELFDPVIFSIVSAAVVLNRIKKMTIDPLAMRADKTMVIVIGFVISTPITLALGTIALLLRTQFGVELTYFFGYAITAIITFIALRKSNIYFENSRNN